MEQLNQVLPEGKEESQSAGTVLSEKEAPLLNKVRLNFGFFGLLSILFGAFFAFSFYKTGMGFNILFFTVFMTILLLLCMNNLKPPVKKGTLVCYAAAGLFGLSTMLTASTVLQFINFIAILLMLDLSLIHQLTEDTGWDFARYLSGLAGVFFRGIAALALGMPFADSARYLKHTKVLKNDKLRNMIFGVLIALPLLWIIIVLLSGADLLFGDMTKGIYQFIFSADIIGVLLLFLFGFLSCYCILCGAVKQADRLEEKARIKAAAGIAVTFVALICLIYLLFCSIQIIYLFSGGLFILPEHYTFAEYARRGFFELLAVTIINIFIMLVCTLFFEDSRLLRVLLTCMTVCTYIMIVSAVYRMLLYIGAYHLTFLRLFVLLALFMDALILAGVIAAVYNRKFPLFRYCTAVITISYLVFSFVKPDYFIASYLINEKEILQMEDAEFITKGLSADAAAVVLPILEDEERWNDGNNNSSEFPGEYGMLDEHVNGSLYYYRESYANQIHDNASERKIRDFNLSIWQANRRLIEGKNIN